jgi:predicted HicB family RNase H-like nuclease
MLELILQTITLLVLILALALEITEPGRKKRWLAITAMSLAAVGAGLGAKSKFDEEGARREFAVLYNNDSLARQQDVEDTHSQLWELLHANKEIPDRLKPMLEVVATFIVTEEKKNLRLATKTFNEKLDEKLSASSTAMTKTFNERLDEKLSASNSAMTKTFNEKLDEKLSASSTAMTKTFNEKLDEKLSASSTAMTKTFNEKLDEKLSASSTAMTKTFNEKLDEKLSASSTAMTKTFNEKLDEKLSASSTAMTKTVDEKLSAQQKALESVQAKLAELELALKPAPARKLPTPAPESATPSTGEGGADNKADEAAVASERHGVATTEGAQAAK